MEKTDLKILWLATDRSNRVADIFGPLQKCVSDLVKTDFIFRQLEVLPKAWQQIYTTGRRRPTKLLNTKLASKYDFIMVDAPFAFLDEDWHEVKTKKGVLIEDQHGDVLEYSKRYIEHRFDIFFTRYNNILELHPNLKEQNIKWLPHSIDTSVFHDYEKRKKYDCLMVGRLNEKIYPLRSKIHGKLIKSGINYFKVNRPEEYLSVHNRWPIGQDYAKLINSSRITFTCTSIYEYPVMKFFEIPACNSALFSNYNNELKNLGFIPDVNMVDVGDGDKIISLLRKWLDSPKELQKLSQNGYDFIHENHTASVRARQFINLVGAEI